MSVQNIYSGKKVLITGAGGFIGQHLVNKFLQLGCEIAAIARAKNQFPKTLRILSGNIEDKDFVDKTIHDFSPHFVFHLAAARDRSLTQEAFNNTIQVNIVGTLNVLFACTKISQLKRIVVLGTAEEYGPNTPPFEETMRELSVSAYSFSKQSATHLAQLMHSSFGLPAVIVRPSIAYGPGQKNDMFLPALIQSLLKGRSFPMTMGEQTRDYIYIDDLVQALLKAGSAFLESDECHKINGEIINIGSGQPIQIAQLVQQVEKILNVKGLAQPGAIQYRKTEQMNYWLSISKAKELLKWKNETSLTDGLEKTIHWIQEQKPHE